MNWSAIGTTVLTNIIFIGFLLAIVRFLGAKWLGTRIEQSIKFVYNKELEDHKAQLQKDLNKSIEEMKAGFQEAVDQKATDKALFLKFMENLPSNGSIEFLKTFDMAFGSFKYSQLSQLKEFYYNCNKPEYEFLDSELESKRKNLRITISEYLDFYGQNTFLTEKDSERAHVPPEWKISQPERFREIVDGLNSLADEVVLAHEDFVRSARSTLKC